MAIYYYRQRQRYSEEYTSAYDALYAYSHGWKTLFNPKRWSIRRAVEGAYKNGGSDQVISLVMGEIDTTKSISPTGKLAAILSVIAEKEENLSPVTLNSLRKITCLDKDNRDDTLLRLLRQYSAPLFIRFFTGGLPNLYVAEVRNFLREYNSGDKTMDDILKDLKHYAKTDVALHAITTQFNQLAAQNEALDNISNVDKSDENSTADESKSSNKKSGTYSELSEVMMPLYDETIKNFIEQIGVNFASIDTNIIEKLNNFTGHYIELLHAENCEDELAALNKLRLPYFWFMREVKKMLDGVDTSVNVKQAHVDEGYLNSLNQYQLLELYMSGNVWVHKTVFENKMEPQATFKERRVAYGTIVAFVKNLSEFCLDHNKNEIVSVELDDANEHSDSHSVESLDL